MYNLISETCNVLHHRHPLSVLIEFLKSVGEADALEQGATSYVVKFYMIIIISTEIRKCAESHYHIPSDLFHKSNIVHGKTGELWVTINLCSDKFELFDQSFVLFNEIVVHG
jgi:hypothetical protein